MMILKPPTIRLTEKAEQILRGALPEFLNNGYAGTSMDKVAKTAGVSKQTLYSYFCDKEGLFTALIKYVACQKFRLVWSQPLMGEPQAVLTQLAQRILQEIHDPEHLCFVRLIIAESEKHPELSQLFLQTVAQPAIAILKNYLEEHSELNIDDPEVIAHIFVGTLIHHTLTQEMLHGKEIIPMKAEGLIKNLVNLIVN
ncbi:TetR/AcrR family transcriptional regulator [Crocosphaera sp. UHCC 0190]|uniref:TetR/AcrR family transcriptional regulator n=1 Tax=Crocosphaera sp. UHCC 0190 TaxID=3110246 RepID=UPI002B212A40|nr:TetR/AcrR family transcriptional regulator [Crocosphaera sp. UHCC 0190]MEA5511038.1 TetR/AcrR family transcriptional regulator [Crocosphaera sp. UHCC 0190]